MTKLSWFWLICIILLYLATAFIFVQSPEVIISKHPLTIYSIIVLSGVVLSLKMEGHYKSILLFILAFLMSVVYLSQIVGA